MQLENMNPPPAPLPKVDEASLRECQRDPCGAACCMRNTSVCVNEQLLVND